MNTSFAARLVIGGVVSFFIVWLLSAYDKRLANLYVILFILIILVTYRNQIIPSINTIIGTIQGSLS